jgi:hypothetical protein
MKSALDGNCRFQAHFQCDLSPRYVEEKCGLEIEVDSCTPLLVMQQIIDRFGRTAYMSKSGVRFSTNPYSQPAPLDLPETISVGRSFTSRLLESTLKMYQHLISAKVLTRDLLDIQDSGGGCLKNGIRYRHYHLHRCPARSPGRPTDSLHFYARNTDATTYPHFTTSSWTQTCQPDTSQRRLHDSKFSHDQPYRGRTTQIYHCAFGAA